MKCLQVENLCISSQKFKNFLLLFYYEIYYLIYNFSQESLPSFFCQEYLIFD